MEILGSKLLVYPKAKNYQIHWSLLVVNVLRNFRIQARPHHQGEV